MAFLRFPAKTALTAMVFLAAGSFAARADDAPAAAPTAAAIDSARTIIVASGMARSFDLVIPEIFGQLDRNVTATRPELKDTLHTVLLALVPEFSKTEEDLIANSAVAVAKRMSEQELKDTAAFFTSASGKKYVSVQPLVFNDILGMMQGWRDKLSVDVLARAHEEMKKKGMDF